MRFNTKVALGLLSVALVGFGNVAFADEIDDALGDTATSSADSSSATPAINKPTFSVSISLFIVVATTLKLIMSSLVTIAFSYQCALLRAIYPWLGLKVESQSRQERK